MSRIDDLIAEFCPNGVKFKELQDLFITKNGYTPSTTSKAYWTDGTVPWFRMEDIRENGRILSKSLQQITKEAVKGGRLFPANSIIVATSATIGEHALITVPHLSNQRFTSLALKPEFAERLNIKFIFYYCFVLDDWCRNNTTTSSFASVEMNRFKKFLFPIPPLEIQCEIVKVLDTFTKLEAELEAELEARRRQYKYYRDALLTFGGRERLTQARIMTLDDAAIYVNARISSTGLDAGSYVGVDNLLSDMRGKTTSNYVPTSGTVIGYEVGDILVGNIRPYLKKIWLADSTGGTNQDVLVVRIKEDERDNIKPRYLYHLLASDQFFAYDMQYAKGTKMPRGDKTAIMQYEVAIPSIKEQARIVSILDKFDALVNDLSSGLPAEIRARRQQYEHYRNRLLTFRETA